EAGAAHLRAALEYLSCAALSRYAGIALALSGLAAIGALALLYTKRWRALVYLSFPVFYLFYMTQQKVIIVRNLLVLIPFLSLLAARGGAVCARAASRIVRGTSAVVAAALASVLAVNAAWLVWTARSIAEPIVPIAAAAEYLNRHPDERFFVTPKVSAQLM